MDLTTIQSLDRQYFMQTYNRFPVALDHGEGARLWDTEGKPYIDFGSGIGTASLGYGNGGWVNAVAEQAARLPHASNLFYTEPSTRLGETLCRRSGMSNAFFCNSGAEANEGLIKLARKYSFDKYGKGRGTVLTLRNSFHGRTITTLAATGQDVFHNYFFPFTEGFRHAEPNLPSVESVAGHDVCAVLVELIQGEGGVYPLDREFVRNLAILCAERDWLLLIDEIQTGIGRTGSLFAYQQYGVRPDAVSFAKGIAGGLPLGGILAGEKCRAVLTAGTHGTTFGGNPICCAAALAVLEQVDDDLLAAVAEKGRYLRKSLAALDIPCLGDSRGMGLMIGIEVLGERTNRQLAEALIENGLLVLTAGKCLRFLPPLTITRAEIDAGLAILESTLGGLR